MKRDLRGYSNGQHNGKSNTGKEDYKRLISSADPEQLKNMEDAVSYYGSKSETELMNELIKGRSEGMIDETQLNEVAARIAPMLNQEQLTRLSAVMERLKR